MKFRLNKVRLNRGGYDRTGYYWGVGLPLWEYEDENGTVRQLRAADRFVAKKLITNWYPNATFYR